jgi:hypothetical protein
MTMRIPKGITRMHILAAIEDLKKGVPYAFGMSVFYDTSCIGSSPRRTRPQPWNAMS